MRRARLIVIVSWTLLLGVALLGVALLGLALPASAEAASDSTVAGWSHGGRVVPRWAAERSPQRNHRPEGQKLAQDALFERRVPAQRYPMVVDRHLGNRIDHRVTGYAADDDG